MHSMRLFLAVAFFSVVLVKGVPRVRSNCNVEGVTHCCQEVADSSDPHAAEILQAMGIPVPPKPMLVGKNCTGTQGQGGVASPVCCSGNSKNDAAFDCSPVNEHRG
ncbi:hypothetical protein P691DRAFT_734938 [Macrolepiota fuliginosa MF-IS2]|uniref:Hydrophobin n=1 Tax=Macrolepiota fuliginosa MF-IS2 TaxID=1400762 RepID=A0A9P6C1A8_9AGAR|nr:hypothetical protein P691DRAFT_734938 [Macrolepiota fuliginosa MF-IS2]